MTSKITGPDKGEVLIGGTRFPLAKNGQREGTVQSLDITVRPQKRLEGDITRTSNPNLSNIAFSDFRGGMLLDVMEGDETNRCWFSNLDTRYKRSLVLGPKISSISTAGSAVGDNVIEFKNKIYGTLSTDVNSITNNTTIATGVQTLAVPMIDAAVGYIGGTYALVFGSVAHYTTFDGGTWTNVSTGGRAAIRIAIWDNRLWALDDDLETMWTTYSLTAAGDAVNAKLPPAPTNTAADFGSLFVAPDPQGDEALYLTTLEGLWIYDGANDRWLKTKFDFPASTSVSVQSAVWNSAIYFASRGAVIEYVPYTGQTTVRNIGLNVDDGLTSDENSPLIRLLIPTPDALLAVTNQEVYSWNGRGWWQMAKLGSTMATAQGLFMGLAKTGADTRLWWSRPSQTTYEYILLDDTFSNPKNDSTYQFTTTGLLKTSWFSADQVDVDKLAVRLKVETKDTNSSGETIKIEYAIDQNEGSSDANYKTLGNSDYTDGLIDIVAAGITTTTFTFPRDTDDVTVAPVGKTFKYIRFKVTLASNTAANSPVLVSMTLEHRKKYERKEGFTFVIDLKDRYKGNTAAKLRKALKTLVESNTLSEFTFRDDSGGSRNYYVDVRIPSAEESTGHLEEGQTLVEVKEL